MFVFTTQKTTFIIKITKTVYKHTHVCINKKLKARQSNKKRKRKKKEQTHTQQNKNKNMREYKYNNVAAYKNCSSIS